MYQWENYKNKWYTTKIRIESPQKFQEVISWMNDNLQGHKKHTVWRLTDGGWFEIRFRFEKDFEWFVLRWS